MQTQEKFAVTSIWPNLPFRSIGRLHNTSANYDCGKMPRNILSSELQWMGFSIMTIGHPSQFRPELENIVKIWAEKRRIKGSRGFRAHGLGRSKIACNSAYEDYYYQQVAVSPVAWWNSKQSKDARIETKDDLRQELENLIIGVDGSAIPFTKASLTLRGVGRVEIVR